MRRDRLFGTGGSGLAVSYAPGTGKRSSTAGPTRFSTPATIKVSPKGLFRTHSMRRQFPLPEWQELADGGLRSRVPMPVTITSNGEFWNHEDIFCAALPSACSRNFEPSIARGQMRKRLAKIPVATFHAFVLSGYVFHVLGTNFIESQASNENSRKGNRIHSNRPKGAVFRPKERFSAASPSGDRNLGRLRCTD